MKNGEKKMNPKFGAALIVPLMLVAMAGLGFAAYTSTINELVSAKAGSITPHFTDWQAGVMPSYTTVVFTGTTSTELHVTVGAFAPGDNAIVKFKITNDGDIPGTLSETVTGTGSYGYGPFLYTDDVAGTILNPGQSAWCTATISLPSGTITGSGTTYTWTVAITATAGS